MGPQLPGPLGCLAGLRRHQQHCCLLPVQRHHPVKCSGGVGESVKGVEAESVKGGAGESVRAVQEVFLGKQDQTQRLVCLSLVSMSSRHFLNII